MIPIWRDPTVSGIGRLPMHGLPHPDRFPLDGRWDFQLLPTPDAEPAPDGWREIDVPGLWTRQGTTDLPHYTNVQMPWPHRPPDLPAENPTGWYRRTFVVPTGWRDRRVVLHVGAAESVLLVTLNGRDVGASKDSHLAAEFDVTGFLVPGDNELLLRVVKWSDASYVEDQDQWWHGGISRSVYVYATDPVHLADVRANAGLDADGTTGTLRFTARVAFAGRAAEPGWQVAIRLPGLGEAATADAVVTPVPHVTNTSEGEQRLLARAASGDALTDDERAVELPALRRRLVPVVDGEAAIDLTLPGIRPWSGEDPHLEPLEVELHAPDGAVVERTTLQVGFRRVEIVGRDLLINGARVFLRGINRHDFDQHTGRVIAADSIRDDLILLRRFGFNAVRTSHYPNDPAFLALADELGMYVVAEADIESHAFWGTLCDDPQYLGAVGGAGRPDGAARQGPSVRDPLVARQRVRARRQPRGGCGLAPAIRPQPADPVRGRHPLRLRAGHSVTDVVCPMYAPISGDLGVRPTPARRSAADPVRVQPRDGQQQRHARRVLGRDRVDAGSPGRLHLGVLGSRPPPGPARRPPAVGLWRRLRRRAERRQLRARRDGLAGSPTEARDVGAPHHRRADRHRPTRGRGRGARAVRPQPSGLR